MTYKNRDKSLRTCIALNEFSDELVERRVAEKIQPDEAEEVLGLANEHGLLRQALYIDWIRREVFDVCSCCPCCCMYLRAYMNYGIKHHIAKSGFVSIVNPDKCIGCGACIERCIFEARSLVGNKCVVDEEKCFGCGLCTTVCPTGAVGLVRAI
ncbi:MAG: hypothetical protein DRO05_07855 [Thermoproteota archaeon]|nr:MAG: hypothetical protein DRO05_07855 [Candidatus Korarchaeota archaeon]